MRCCVQEHEMLCRDPAKKDRTEQIQPRRLAGCVVCTCVRAGESGRTIAPQREAGRRPPQHSILQACHACMCIGATTDRGTAAACGRAGRRQERPSLPFHHWPPGPAGQSVDDTATGAPAPASRRALMRRFTLTATATYEYDRPDPSAGWSRGPVRPVSPTRTPTFIVSYPTATCSFPAVPVPVPVPVPVVPARARLVRAWRGLHIYTHADAVERGREAASQHTVADRERTPSERAGARAARPSPCIWLHQDARPRRRRGCCCSSWRQGRRRRPSPTPCGGGGWSWRRRRRAPPKPR